MKIVYTIIAAMFLFASCGEKKRVAVMLATKKQDFQ